jgi:hypothetical protein
MRNFISGIVGVAFGGFILLNGFLRGGPQGAGAYRAGQIAAMAFGGLLLVGGMYYLVQGLKGANAPTKRRKQRKKRRPDSGGSPPRAPY